jgi:hypothetical protein
MAAIAASVREPRSMGWRLLRRADSESRELLYSRPAALDPISGHLARRNEIETPAPPGLFKMYAMRHQ